MGALLQAGDVVALVGELGAGKTHFVKGVCAGLGVADAHRVGSPTFVLCNEYPGRLPVFHLDAYRLASQNELWELGIDEMFDSAGVVLVEWADRAPDVIPPSALRVAFETLGPDRRLITLSAPANRVPTRSPSE